MSSELFKREGEPQKMLSGGLLATPKPEDYVGSEKFSHQPAASLDYLLDF